uniref:Uncharacterized protein n=1 Tax=Hemiselmis andersenii TaxID=464988 RepID=A0A6U5BCI9_HEMAN|mmetsp:Transcript_52753/g.127766  ORF Transcript_52753/g.127766 Transcript_52753/m.127766 type:complete len:197 (-) Transcript_52753:117-707(-)
MSSLWASPPSSFSASWLYSKLLSWIQSIFWRQHLELTMVGLQNAGKTTLINVFTDNKDHDTIPTVGFNMRRAKRGGVSIKLWDLGGQPRFRGMWERYCRGVHAIVFVVDSADPSSIPAAERELHELIGKPSLQGTPLLVLANKNDIPRALDVADVITEMGLEKLSEREVCCYSVSAFTGSNIDATLAWLTKRSVTV